jgi:hypothetical protein
MVKAGIWMKYFSAVSRLPNIFVQVSDDRYRFFRTKSLPLLRYTAKSSKRHTPRDAELASGNGIPPHIDIRGTEKVLTESPNRKVGPDSNIHCTIQDEVRRQILGILGGNVSETDEPSFDS